LKVNKQQQYIWYKRSAGLSGRKMGFNLFKLSYSRVRY